MKAVLLAAGLSLISSVAFGQSAGVSRYDNYTIDSSIRCELSRVDRDLRKANPTFTALRAHLKVTQVEKKNEKVGASVGFFIFTGGASYNSIITKQRTVEYNRNINEKNRPNCRKSFVVDLSLYDCFRQSLHGFSGFNLSAKGSKVVCTLDSTATSEVIAGGKFKLWVLEAGPSGDLSYTRTWNIEVTAPPPG